MPLPLPVEGVPATPIPDVFEGLKVTPPKFFLRASAWSLALPTPAKCGELTPVELGEVGCPRILYIRATSGFSFETSVSLVCISFPSPLLAFVSDEDEVLLVSCEENLSFTTYGLVIFPSSRASSLEYCLFDSLQITEFSRGDRDSAFILSRQCWNIGFFAVVTLVAGGSLRSKSES